MHDGANKQADCTVLTGSNLDHLPTLADRSVDACVTDPPYELGFMGKAWDKSGIAYNVELWREVFRVLKPGAYLLAFGGSRTYHRMASAIEDAGFEIRDQIQWIYGSGFPKSLDVSKAIDKMNGDERPVVGVSTAGVGNTAASMHKTEGFASSRESTFNLTSAASAASAAWDGWGTALKPAHEPIVMARKPLEKGLTVAQNVLKWGTGAINIDKCRISTEETLEGGATGKRTALMSMGGHNARPNHSRAGEASASSRYTENGSSSFAAMPGPRGGDEKGRFPANVIHDGSDEVLAGFPHTASGQPCGTKAGGRGNVFGEFAGGIAVTGFGDEGSAARFFYSPKASKYDREAGLDANFAAKKADTRDAVAAGLWEQMNAAHKNHHPTVKPTDLMQYLCRLVTPPGGLILDPFLGSGSTMKAALIERFRCIGIELNPEYAEIARARLTQLQVKLF